MRDQSLDTWTNGGSEEGQEWTICRARDINSYKHAPINGRTHSVRFILATVTRLQLTTDRWASSVLVAYSRVVRVTSHSVGSWIFSQYRQVPFAFGNHTLVTPRCLGRLNWTLASLSSSPNSPGRMFLPHPRQCEDDSATYFEWLSSECLTPRSGPTLV